MISWLILIALIVIFIAEWGGFRILVDLLREIICLLKRIAVQHPVAFGPIIQIGEDDMPTDNSIVAGTSGVFQTSYVPAGSVPPAGAPNPTWAASDPSIVLAPDPSDASGLTVGVSVPAGFSGGSFQLGISGPEGAGGATITGGPITVTVTQPAPPAPTGFGPINQLS